MKARRALLPLVAVAGLVWVAACEEQPVAPGQEGANVTPLFTASTAYDAYTGGGSITGAIWTSDQDRTVVNENVGYASKEDVYLNGGPLANRPNAPGSLSPTDTWYVFQVTDPSGKDLLSNDPWWCRLVRVENGRFVDVPDDADDVRNALTAALGTDYTSSQVIGGDFTKVQGKWSYDNDLDCNHMTGPSYADTFEGGGISVQLVPYDDTPNNGNVYKAWITPVRDFTCKDQDSSEYEGKQANTDPNYEECGDQWHGFVGAFTKTDNYKVKKQGAEVDGLLIVKKFHDADFDGLKDATEEWVTGWAIDVTDPLSTTNTYYTQVNIPVVPVDPPDVYVVDEDEPTGTLHTATYVDGSAQTGPPNPVSVTFIWDYNGGNYYEEHTVVFGNVGLGSIKGCKVFDNQDQDPIPGWKLILTGTLADDAQTAITPDTVYTGSDGCYTWTNVYPGNYRVTEVLPPSPPDYTATTPLYFDVTITSTLSGSTISANNPTVTFKNVCTDTADFSTKGFWHNKNGLDLITDDMIAYVNTLDPYDGPSGYFEAGDEPFDGYFSNLTTCVKAAYNNDKITDGIAAGECQARAEISHFLTENIGEYGQCKQLAEQLLAFIFNVEYYLGGGGTLLVNGSTIHTDAIIQDAIDVWADGMSSGDDSACATKQGYITAFNESDAVPYVPDTYCPFSYPAD